MFFKAFVNCFKGAAHGVDDYRLRASKAVGSSNQLVNRGTPATQPTMTTCMAMVSTDVDCGSAAWDTGTPFQTGSWKAATSSPEDAAHLTLANKHEDPKIRGLKAVQPSWDSLVCAHMPAAITVFNRHRAPIHQNLASVLLYGQAAMPCGIGGGPDTTLLYHIFVLQPEKLEAMWHEVMGPGGGRWKGIIRVPPQLLVPRPVPEWSPGGFGAAAPGSAASPLIHRQPKDCLPSGLYNSSTGHQQDVGELGDGGDAAKAVADAVASHGGGGSGGGDGGGGGGHVTGGPCTASASAATSPRPGVLATMTAMGASADSHLYDNAGNLHPRLTTHLRPDDAPTVRAASRLRPGVASSAAAAVGTARTAWESGRRRSAAAMPRTRSSCSGVLTWVGPRRNPATGTGGGRQASASDAARVEPMKSMTACTEGSVAARAWERPHSASGQCTKASPFTGRDIADSGHICRPTVTPFFKRSSLPDPVPKRLGQPPGLTVQLTLVGGPQRNHPGNPLLPARDSLEASLFSTGGSSGTAPAAPAAILSPSFSATRCACPLGFDPDEVPESTAATTQASRSRVWDAAFNPLATSAFGLTLGATFDGLTEASVPTSALVSVVASTAAAAAAAGTAAVVAAAAGPGHILNLMSPQRDSFNVRRMSAPRGFANSSVGATFINTVAAAALPSLPSPSPSASPSRAFLLPSPLAAAHLHRHKPFRTISGSISLCRGGGGGSGPPSRVLAFASSLRNAPVATQLLAEASRPGSAALAAMPPPPSSAKATASPGMTSTAPVGWEPQLPQLQPQQPQQPAPVMPRPGGPRTLLPPSQMSAADGRGSCPWPAAPSASWALAAHAALARVEADCGAAVAAAAAAHAWPPSINAGVGGGPGLTTPSADSPENPMLSSQRQWQRQARRPSGAWDRQQLQQRQQQGGGEGPIAPAWGGLADLPTVDWPTGLDSSSTDGETPAGDGLLPSEEGEEDGEEQHQHQHQRQDLQPQQQQQADGRRQLASPLASAGREELPVGGPAQCWHEVWATRGLDPVTGDEVLVLAQHDVTAKVVAERHLALVMEAEHRLLEQLFPKHILTHVTEEWIAEAERAAVEARSVPALPTPKPSARWRPVIRDCNSLATWHPQVTLLFADIRGFTPMCKRVTPREVMTMLNDLFSRFDEMLDRFGVFKVETIGDCYFVAGGLIQEDEDGMAAVRDEDSRGDPLHAHKVFMFAKAMLAAAREVRMPSSGEPVQIRIGISSGPVVSGVVGTRMPRFCLFGDTVNTTSRMESTGQPGAIHASESAYLLLKSESWEPTGGIEVKGKGVMRTYLWRPQLDGGAAGGRESTVSRLPVTAEEAVAALRLAADATRRGGIAMAASAATGCKISSCGSLVDTSRVAGSGPVVIPSRAVAHRPCGS